MKLDLFKTLDKKEISKSPYLVQRLNLSASDTIDYLRQLLPEVMANSLDPDLNRSPEIYLINLMANRLGDFSNRYIITCKDQGEDIGLLIALPISDYEYNILTLGVRENYRNKGIGRYLLCCCQNELLDANVKTLIINVHTDNLPAFRLYQNLGFLRKD